MQKVRIIKSICGKYTLVYTNHVQDGDIINNEGIIYLNGGLIQSKNGAFYSIPHCITGYSAYAEGLHPGKFFTMRFSDCKKGVRLIPFTGNSVLKSYEAIFRVQKYNYSNLSTTSNHDQTQN